MRRLRAGSFALAVCCAPELLACEAGDESPASSSPAPPDGKNDGVPADCSEFSFDLAPPEVSPEFTLSTLLPYNAPGPTIWAPSAAFDVGRDRLVSLDPESGTWEWSPQGGWALRADLASGPRVDGRNQGVRLAYDRHRGRTVLFGGLDATTWEWDGASWTGIDAVGPTPLARNDSALAYDGDQELTWMFGGQSVDGTRLRDLWSWDGVAWEQHHYDGPGPEARRGHEMVYDASRSRLVVHGGISNDTRTWEWDGQRWESFSGGSLRKPFDALVFDEGHGQVLGLRAGVKPPLGEADPWAWDGQRWQRVLAGEMPKRQLRSGVVYDPLRGRTLLMQPRHTLGSLAQLVRGSATNRSPSITLLTPVPERLWPGDPLELQLGGEDPDGHAVQLDASELPDGATFDPDTGVLQWTPAAEQAGYHVLTVGVSDGDLCSQLHLGVRVVDPVYSDLPVGGYGLYQQSVSIPADYIERYFQFQRYYARSHEVPDSGALCSVFGENPGKLTVVCEARTPNHWTGPPYRFVDLIGGSPVDPDGSFDLQMTWGGGTSPSTHPSHFPSPGDVGTPVTDECPFIEGHLNWVEGSRVEVVIDHLDTSCPRTPTESGARSTAASTVNSDFRGYAFDSSVVPPSNVGPGVGLATATFWHADQQRLINVDGPFWLEWAGGVYTLEGVLVATSDVDVPTLLPSIDDIFRDEEGTLVVVQ